MATKVLGDKRGRSVKEVANVALWVSGAIDKASHEALTGAAVFIGEWEKLQVIMDLTALDASDAADTLDIYIDLSYDNVSWMNAGCFTRLLGNGAGAYREIITFVPGGAATVPATVLSGNCASAVIREHVYGLYIRYRTAITDATGDAEWTLSLTAMVTQDQVVRAEESEIKLCELLPLAARTEIAATDTDIWEIGDNWEWMQVVLNTTVGITVAADHLDVNLYLSNDGVQWVSIGAFTQGDGDDNPLIVELIHYQAEQLPLDIDAVNVLTAACAEHVIRAGYTGKFLKAIYTLTNDTTVGYTFSVKAWIK